MSYNKGFYTENLAQDAMAVVAKWIAKVPNLKVVFHNGKAVCAEIFKAIIHIPKLACSSGLTEKAMMLLRGRIYHEAGHIAYTKLDKSEYPKGILHEIWNAIEDRRMERQVADNYVGAGPVFRHNAEYYNHKIAGDVADGKVDAPLWEALVAMGFQSEGLPPLWRLSEKAQVYFDAGYNTFCKWKNLKNAKGALKLAEELYEILKDTHEDYQQQQGEGEGGEGEDGEPQQGMGGGSSSGEPQEGEEQERTGDPHDFDNEGDDQQGGGSGEAGDEEGEDEGGSAGKDDDEGKEEGKSAGEKDDEDGAEGAEKATEDSEGEDDGSESDGEGEDAGGSENASGEGEEDGGTPESGGDETESRNGNKYDTNYDEKEGQGRERTEAEEKALEKELESEADGKGMSDYQDEDIEKEFDELDPADASYLSRRDLDEHILVQGTERDKEIFKKDREEVAAATAAMVRALEQAMRSRTRCRRNPYLRSGKIDHNRLVHIAKSISKEVFYKTRQGEKLETAVEIVIDESGSMGYYRQVRQVAIAVCEALAQLNIPFEITGSTTKYGCGDSGIPKRDGLSRTNPILYHHFKTFGQQWAQVRHHISQSTAYMHNVDGEVVEYAARRLQARPEARKIVLSLCDGCPDAGHGNGSEMGRNIVRTCERAREAGIEVYAFGIGTHDPARYYGEENFVYVPKEDIDTAFVSKFVAIVSGGRFQVAVRG